MEKKKTDDTTADGNMPKDDNMPTDNDRKPKDDDVSKDATPPDAMPMPPSPPPWAGMPPPWESDEIWPYCDGIQLPFLDTFYKRGVYYVWNQRANPWLFNSRAWRGGPNQQRSNQPPSRAGNASPSANSPSSLAPPSLPPVAPTSPSMAASTIQVNEQAHQSNQGARKPPFFFREEHAGYIVKGNFMTLAAKPHLVEEGEWIGHQVSEQARVLSGMVKIVQEPDRSTGIPICNERSCPAMSAGATTYSWMDTNRNPINLPAPTYIKHIQTWVSGKIIDENIFPTAPFQTPPTLPNPQQAANDPNHWLGKTSGFPQRFEGEIKNMYRQMFRCYAHLYWSHWLDFWHLGCHRELNTSFVHFVNVGRIFGLLSDRDTEPMQPLIDLWIRKGDLPQSKEVESASASTSAPASAATPTSTSASPSGGASAT